MELGPLIVAAGLFAFVTGANDGAALLSTNLGSKAIPPLGALLLLVAAVIVGPYVLGTAVATTLASGLVHFDRAGGGQALLAAVGVVVVLIVGLNRLGIPTSVMQALTGAIIGVGLGRGLAVDASVALKVILVLVVAPLLSGALGWAAALVLGRLRPPHGVRRQVRVLQGLAWAAQCVAYAANDSQKMVAVFAIALGIASAGALGTASVTLPSQIAIGALFLAGTLFGAARLGGRIGRLLQITPMTTVGAGYGSAVAVLVSATAGAPVSMSQANASALVGAQSVVAGYRRVRWEQAARILSTWVTTFPTAFAVAAIIGWGMRG